MSKRVPGNKSNNMDMPRSKTAESIHEVREMEGKKCSSLHPGKFKPVDQKVAVLLGISFPIAFLVFWKVTLPFFASICSLIIGVDVVQTLAFLQEDIMNAMTSPCPNWISAEERAFIRNSSPKQIRRVSNLTFAEFEQIVNAGEPIVVSDGMKDWPGLGSLNCQSFFSKYPDAEYFDWQGQVITPLKDINKRKSYKGLECAAGYIDVRTPTNAKYIQDWVNQVRAPYFLSEDVYTREPFANASHPNMNFFIGTKNTGVSPHLDETCDTFMTAQFSSVKNWSLSWPIKEEGELRWSNPIVFTLYPGAPPCHEKYT
ncbi:uncharacterized protein LOC117105115 isoform X3 [Anneissia japonica]|uniref:uncharacterized protein LOC117105115 isoform X3 n=1 Tax=Anneissia japonica TaxID=1529436 RepID=UPI0014257E67|nr:uncharacterized protein LOC117105115 isoform X3 [Anneissia japonica]